MGNIKTKHRGGSPASKPSIDKKSHPMQKPGDASKNSCSHMEWKGHEKGYK